jgi:hypothetical protein
MKIRTIYPNTEVQTCIDNLKGFDEASELKPVYRADNESQALDELAKLKEKWNKNIPW